MDLQHFRKQVNAGRANLEKRKATKEKEDCTFYTVNARGEVENLDITVYIKRMSCTDYEDYFRLTSELPEEVKAEFKNDKKPIPKVASKYAGTVIVGVVDVKGNRIFSEDDIEFLDDALNAKQTMKLSAVVSSASGLTDAAKAEKKARLVDDPDYDFWFTLIPHMGSGGLTIREWQDKMPREEFEDWKDKYLRSPWGIVPEDRRNANICIYLQGIMNMWAKNKQKVDVDQLFMDKTGKEYEKIKQQLYSIIETPWLEIGVSAEELALEGQAIFKALQEKYG